MTNLQILIAAGDPQDKKYAERILPVRENGHLLLITLLLGTVVINESIPILMDSVIGGGIYAVIVSTFLVVVFGEIIPNAICNVYGLAIGAFFAPFIRVCMFLMWPVAYPIAKLLDCLLGHKEGVVYRRAELKTLIAMHQESQGMGSLSNDEVNIIQGVLDLSAKTVHEVMTPLEDVFSLNIEEVLDAALVDKIKVAGHSRIPVYEGDKENLIAMFLVKSLVGYYVEDAQRVRDFPLSFLPIVGAQTEVRIKRISCHLLSLTDFLSSTFSNPLFSPAL
jgi:CBS domain containing-hemolysin-like protein